MFLLDYELCLSSYLHLFISTIFLQDTHILEYNSFHFVVNSEKFQPILAIFSVDKTPDYFDKQMYTFGVSDYPVTPRPFLV